MIFGRITSISGVNYLFYSKIFIFVDINFDEEEDEEEGEDFNAEEL